MNRIKKINKSIPIGITQVKIIEYLIKSPVTYQKDLEKVIKPEEAEQITDNAKKIGGLSI